MPIIRQNTSYFKSNIYLNTTHKKKHQIFSQIAIKTQNKILSKYEAYLNTILFEKFYFYSIFRGNYFLCASRSQPSESMYVK